MIKHYLKVESEFDRKANTYDVLHAQSHSTMGLHELVRRRLVEKLVQGYGNLLSIGCGPGWYLKNFSERFSCFGVDISIEMLKQCKNNKLKVCQAFGEVLSVRSNTFDCVLCINMFQYVKDPLNLFLEIKRVTKEKGIFIFDFKNQFSPRAATHYFSRMFREEYDSDKEKRYNIFRIRKLISDAKFEIYKIRGMEFHWFPTSTNSRPKFVIELFS